LKKAWTFLRARPIPVSFFSFWILYYGWFWSHAIRFDRAGNLIAGHVNLWGDWALHFTLGSAMAFRDFLLFQSPLLINAPFSYPFLCNLISAALVRAGFPFFVSFTVPSFVLTVAIVFGLFGFYRVIFKSDKVSVVASLIFMLNGGMGFLLYFWDVWQSQPFWKTMIMPPREYTMLREFGISWISVISSIFIPQRAFQLGFPLALLILLAVIKYFGLMGGGRGSEEINRPSRDRGGLGSWPFIYLMGAALLLGIMPIAHTYAFMMLGFLFVFWMLGDFAARGTNFFKTNLKAWLLFGGVSLVVAYPLLKMFVFPNVMHGGFFHWEPGGFAKTGQEPWFEFWWANWGVTPYVAFIGWVFWILKETGWRGRTSRLLYSIPFFLMFGMANLFVFQPWVWDNTKIIVWASLGMSGFAGYFLWVYLWEKREPAKIFGFLTATQAPRRVLAIFLFIFMTFAGFLDAYRILIPRFNQNEMFTAEDLYLAAWVKENTPAHSLFLTAPFHNHWLPNLTGRRVLMCFDGWLWTHGYGFQEIRQDLGQMFRHPEKRDLFVKYAVDYVVVGPFETRDMKADPTRFAALYETVLKTERYSIFYVRHTALPDEKTGMERQPAIFDQPVRLGRPLRPGLVEKAFGGIYFQGTLLKERTGLTILKFDYPSDSVKPIKAPFSLIWEGFIRIEGGGIYEFFMGSDDGAWLYIDDQLLIDNGGIHGIMEKKARALLTTGVHRLKIKYFDNHGGAVFNLNWQPPGQQRGEIPPHLLFS